MDNDVKTRLWVDLDWRFWGLGVTAYAMHEYSYICVQIGPVTIFFGGM